MSEQSTEEVGAKFYLQELKWFLKLGLPLSATYFFNFLQLQIAVAFAGHRSKEELDAIGLANSYYTLVVVSLSVAIGHAFSGRFGAAYGAKRTDLMRDDLHRSIIAGLCIVFGITIPFILVAEYLLKWVSPSVEVTLLAGHYLLILLPGAFGRFINLILNRFCEAQNVALPSLFVNILICFVMGVLCILLVNVYDLGGLGSAIAISVGSGIMPFFTLAMMLAYRKVRATQFWKPRWRCLEGRSFWEVNKLIFSAVVTSLVGWFAGEAGQFLAGRLGTTELAAQTVLTGFTMIFYCIPIGLGSACTSRIAQYVGQKSAAKAKVVYRLTLIIHLMFGLVTAGIYTLFRYQLVGLFTDKEDVIELAVSLTFFVAINDCANFVDIGLSSVLRAAGVFFFMAVEWFVIYYLFALPVCVALMFYAGWGLKGYWVPFCIGCIAEALPMLIYVLCLNWQRIIDTQDAMKTKAPTEGKHSGSKRAGSSYGSTDANSTDLESSAEKTQDTRIRPLSSQENGFVPHCGSPPPVPEESTPLVTLALTERDPRSEKNGGEQDTGLPEISTPEATDEDERIPTRPLAILEWVVPVVICCALLIAVALALRLLRPQILPLDAHTEHLQSTTQHALFNVTSFTQTEAIHLSSPNAFSTFYSQMHST